MSRKPLTSEKWRALQDSTGASRFLAEVEDNAKRFDAEAGEMLRAPRFTKLSELEPSSTGRRRDLLSEPPSTGAPKKSTSVKKPPRRDCTKQLKAATDYGHQVIKGSWEVAAPHHLVGLYAALHEGLYAVSPLELKVEYHGALAAATKLVKEEFNGNAEEAVQYLSWCVVRAKRWKEDNEREGKDVVRLPWRTVFYSRKWLVDFKASGRGKSR